MNDEKDSGNSNVNGAAVMKTTLVFILSLVLFACDNLQHFHGSIVSHEYRPDYGVVNTVNCTWVVYGTFNDGHSSIQAGHCTYELGTGCWTTDPFPIQEFINEYPDLDDPRVEAAAKAQRQEWDDYQARRHK